MKKLFITLFVAGLGLAANAQPPAGDAKAGDWYGEKITQDDAIQLNEIVAKLKAGNTESIDLKVKAKVVDVCSKKGCWLTLELPNGETAMVKMKDYGFFLPVAAKGKTVVIDGTVAKKTTSVAELKHYAEDAGKTEAEIAAIKDPKNEIRVTAKGILVVE
ncbi:MAG: DUF4920 domain-containing protein [Bacteroidetes bacterium]|nr:DUF4920 domain-containing protein [Bacteroidota bacterium]